MYRTVEIACAYFACALACASVCFGQGRSETVLAYKESAGKLTRGSWQGVCRTTWKNRAGGTVTNYTAARYLRWGDLALAAGFQANSRLTEKDVPTIQPTDYRGALRAGQVGIVWFRVDRDQAFQVSTLGSKELGYSRYEFVPWEDRYRYDLPWHDKLSVCRGFLPKVRISLLDALLECREFREHARAETVGGFVCTLVEGSTPQGSWRVWLAPDAGTMPVRVELRQGPTDEALGGLVWEEFRYSDADRNIHRTITVSYQLARTGAVWHPTRALVEQRIVHSRGELQVISQEIAASFTPMDHLREADFELRVPDGIEALRFVRSRTPRAYDLGENDGLTYEYRNGKLQPRGIAELKKAVSEELARHGADFQHARASGGSHVWLYLAGGASCALVALCAVRWFRCRGSAASK